MIVSYSKILLPKIHIMLKYILKSNTFVEADLVKLRLNYFSHIFNLLTDKSWSKAFCLFGLLACLTFQSYGQKTWTGSVNTDWNNSGNWDAGVPGFADTVKIPVVSNMPIINTPGAKAKSIFIENSATLTVNSSGSLRVNGSTKHGLRNKGTLTNNGTITIGDSLSTGTTGIVNQSVFNNNSGASLVINRCSSRGVFNLNGTFNNNGNLQFGTIQPVGIEGIRNKSATFNHNAGTISIEKSYGYGIVTDTSSTFNNKGVLTIGSSSVIPSPIFGTGIFNNEIGGELKAKGTINVSNFNHNGGTLDPGFPIGLMSFAHKNSLNSSIIKITVNGKTSPGFDFDQINVSDTLTFGGTLDLTINMASPNIGDEIPIVSTNGAKDTFDVVNGLLPNWFVIYKNTGAVLRYGVLSETVWIGDSSTVWSDPDNWSAGIPTATSDVFITDTSVYYPILTGTGIAKSIDIKSGGTLTIGSSGVLNLENSNNQAINNRGTVNNSGKINIGTNVSPGSVGILNQSSFFNNTGGEIIIDRSTTNGIVNFGGTFSNSASINIGGVVSPGSNGIWNTGTFNNLAGEIVVNRTSENGVLNDSLATFINSASIKVGNLTSSGKYGVRSKDSFTNNAASQIFIDNVTSSAIFQSYHTFTNDGSISVGLTSGIGDFGFNILSKLVNTGQISIGRAVQSGISINGKLATDTVFVNTGLVVMGQSMPITDLISGSKGYFVNKTSGNLKGSGNVIASLYRNRGGAISPGIAIGSVNFKNTVNMSNGIVNIEVNGNSNPGVNYDLLTAVDTITLGGTLSLNVSYSGAPGDAIDIIIANKVIGTFATVTGLPSGWTVDYSTSKVTLTYITAGTTTWTGAVSSSWVDNGNWSDGVPILSSAVVIPQVSTNNPNISTNVGVKSITINTGGSLTVSANGVLNVNGASSQAVMNNGFIVNNGIMNLGGISNIGTTGIINNGTVSNAQNAHIYIDRASLKAIENTASFTNSGEINVGNSANSGTLGVDNSSTFTNEATGLILIGRTTSSAFQNNGAGIFTNKGVANFGSVNSIGNYGIVNLGIVNNNVGAQLIINRCQIAAIDNQGTLTNNHEIIIGGISSAGMIGISNSDDLTNASTGNIIIDRVTDSGVKNVAGGDFTNNGSVGVGANQGNSLYGIWNLGNFINTGNIGLNNTTTYGLWNNSGTFTNSSMISIGSSSAVGIYGLSNNGTMVNNGAGSILIDRSTSAGIYNYSEVGLFNNTSVIGIGGNASVGSYGIHNIGTFNNNSGGAIHIDNCSNAGIYVDNKVFNNYANIFIGASTSTGLYGVRNRNIFNNESGAIHIDRASTSGFYSEAGTFSNNALLVIGENVPSTNLIAGASGSLDNNPNGIVKGTGTINPNFFEDYGGKLSPGYSPGKITFNNNALLNLGTLDMEIKGKNSAGVDFDQIQVNGSVALGGKLKITNQFYSAVNGDQVTILTASSISGTFSSIIDMPSNWTISYTTTAVILNLGPFLPIDLIRFSAVREQEKVRLSWQTANEDNNKGFDIERSTDGRVWKSIGFVEGKGYSSKISSYEFYDIPEFINLSYSKLYYRLKQVDFNGNTSFSKVETVVFPENEWNKKLVEIYPNPIPKAQRLVVFNQTNTILNGVILSVYGEVKRNVQLVPGMNSFDLKEMSLGTYFLSINNQSKPESYKIIIID